MALKNKYDEQSSHSIISEIKLRKEFVSKKNWVLRKRKTVPVFPEKNELFKLFDNF